MTRQIPVVPTLVVLAAVAAMVWMGFFELHRARESEKWLAQYTAASKLPPIAYPAASFKGPSPLFRWASAFCQKVVGHREIEGRNRVGDIGWVHIVDCATGAEGPGISIEVGWSQNPTAAVNWNGGPVSGVIVPDRIHRIRLIAATAPMGLVPASIPSPANAVPITPGGARLYAVQWFCFAVIGLVIYVLALRKRIKARKSPQ